VGRWAGSGDCGRVGRWRRSARDQKGEDKKDGGGHGAPSGAGGGVHAEAAITA
jgi:hypothetical protein